MAFLLPCCFLALSESSYSYFPGLLAVFEHCASNCHIDLGRIAYEASEEAGPECVLLVVYKADCSVSLTSERSMSMLNNERLAAGPSRAEITESSLSTIFHDL